MLKKGSAVQPEVGLFSRTCWTQQHQQRWEMHVKSKMFGLKLKFTSFIMDNTP